MWIVMGAVLLTACSPAERQDAVSAAPVAPAASIRCTPPTSFAMPRVEPPPADDVRRTPVTRYTLALSWSPDFCATRGDTDDAMQCDGRMARFGFVLHGLWPETDGRNWPQWCAPASRLPRALIAEHLCMTPSPQLLQHEWAKHGTCMTDDPDAYFDRAAALYRGVQFPDMAALAADDDLTVGAFASAFAAANPGMRADMIAVDTRQGGWLEEVALCLDADFAPHACPAASRRTGERARLRITAANPR
jgi:ribonuclease T2